MTFKNTKALKTSQALLGPREKLLGGAGFYVEIFFPKPENGLKHGFSRAKV
jgi:hypothetical protein